MRRGQPTIAFTQQATVIDVGATNQGKQIIDNHDFGMHVNLFVT
jgi:hypothetical protein